MELDELRSRAAAGDREARLAWGTRLLVGDGVAADVAAGTTMIEQASASGSGDAAAFLATIEAVGAGRPQNWLRAFDLLCLAARRGSTQAGRQLAILARDPSLAAAATAAGQADPVIWQRARDRLDPAVLTTPPPKKSLSDQPRVRIIEGFATGAECRWAIDRAQGRMKRALVLDQASGEEKAHPHRTGEGMTLGLTELDVVLQVLRARIATATGLPLPVFEPAQILHYEVGQEFRPHYDYDTQDGYTGQIERYGQRIATFLLYLNADFVGGETDFPLAKLRWRGRAGDCIFFANIDPSGVPDKLTYHAGLPPTRGEKWILSQWIRNRSPAVSNQ